MTDKILFGSVLTLFTLSLVLNYSLSEYTVRYYHYSDYHFFVRQLAAVLLGTGVMFWLGHRDPDRWFVPLGFGLFLLALAALVAMPYLPDTLVKSVMGAKRWIRLGPVSLAPVEFYKVGFVFFLGWSFSRKMPRHAPLTLWEEAQVIFPYLVVFGVTVVLVAFLQNDLGQVAVMGATMLILFMFAGRSVKLFVAMLATGTLALIVLIRFAPYRAARFKSWWSTVQDFFLQFFPDTLATHLRVQATQEPYQIANSLNAIKHSDVWGQGLGAGQFKLGFLSEVHTDFVLSGLTEELGFGGLVFVALLVLVIVFRIFKIAASVDNPAYYIFSTGVGLLIMLAFIVNSYGISGMTPIKGIAVPFLSYGGSQIVAVSIAVGMVLMIARKRVR